MFEEYKKHVAERAENGIPAKPLTAQQVRELITLLENKQCEDRSLINLLINQVSPGVDAAAKVKAEFLDELSKQKQVNSVLRQRTLSPFWVPCRWL
jgi:aconitate hydratase 2/2-methylisocitrate dehydratase